MAATRVAPLPVAPRPFPDETLRSWADRVGAWYGLGGTDLVEVLRQRAHLPGARDFSSLEDCEHDGITPGWVTDLLADAAQLPRAHIGALRQDDYARWIPPHLLWNVLGVNEPRRCGRCVAACGEDHERRAWRAGWTSVCLEHGVVLNTRDRAPSPYAVRLEGTLQEAIAHGNGWVELPWPVAAQSLALPLPLALRTLAALAEYLCDDAQVLLYGLIGVPESNRERSAVATRLVDIAAHAAQALADLPVSALARGSRAWRCRRGLTAVQHHSVMASLGWLLAAWPDHPVRLLFWTELTSQPPWYGLWAEVNWFILQERADQIAWPLWRLLPDQVSTGSPN